MNRRKRINLNYTPDANYIFDSSAPSREQQKGKRKRLNGQTNKDIMISVCVCLS